jgi:hypothetical protein
MSGNDVTDSSSSLRAARAAGVAAIRLRKQQSGSFLDRGSAATDDNDAQSPNIPPSSDSKTIVNGNDSRNGSGISGRLPTISNSDVDEAESDLRMTERMASLSRLVLTNARIRGQHALKLCRTRFFLAFFVLFQQQTNESVHKCSIANLTSRLSLAPSQLPLALLPPQQPFSSSSDEKDGERSAAEEDEGDEDDIHDGKLYNPS